MAQRAGHSGCLDIGVAATHRNNLATAAHVGPHAVVSNLLAPCSCAVGWQGQVNPYIGEAVRSSDVHDLVAGQRGPLSASALRIRDGLAEPEHAI